MSLVETFVKTKGNDRNISVEEMKKFFNTSILDWNARLLEAGEDKEKQESLKQELKDFVVSRQKLAAEIITMIVTPLKIEAAAAVSVAETLNKKLRKAQKDSDIISDFSGATQEMLKKLTKDEEPEKAQETPEEKAARVKLTAEEKFSKLMASEKVPEEKFEAFKAMILAFTSSGMESNAAIKQAKMLLGVS